MTKRLTETVYRSGDLLGPAVGPVTLRARVSGGILIGTHGEANCSPPARKEVKEREGREDPVSLLRAHSQAPEISHLTTFPAGPTRPPKHWVQTLKGKATAFREQGLGLDMATTRLATVSALSALRDVTENTQGQL